MKKLNKIQPKGRMNLHTYLADNAGCGHIRVIFPSLMLNQFKYKSMTFNSTFNSYFINDIDYYKQLSFVKFQRSMTRGQLTCIEMCVNSARSIGSFGVLYEVDDLLTPDIPDTNFSAKYYKEAWDVIKQILNTVDGIIVSTETLKNELSKYTSKKINIIKNRLCSWLWPQKQFVYNKNEKTKILWAGSQNHFSVTGNGGDFNSELINFIKKTENELEWIFVGACPNELKNSNVTIYPWQHILNFGHFLGSLNVDIGIAPLEKCIFNDCKSNIKSLEFCSLGIPGVYSGANPYKNMTMSSDDKFIDNLQSLIKDIELRKEIWDKDYLTLKDELYWDEESLLDYINKHLRFYNKCLG